MKSVKSISQLAFTNSKLVLIVMTFVVFVIFLVVLSVFRSDTIRIDNYEDATLPLLPINNICARNVAFKTYPNLKHSASVRSIPDNQRQYKVSCPVINSSQQINKDYNTIVENGMLYGLYNTCISLDYNNYSLNSETGVITFNFSNKTEYDFKTLSYLYLLNPLYVEINGSEQYYPVFTNVNTFTNITKDSLNLPLLQQYIADNVNFQFSKVLPAANTATNTTFPKTSVPLSSVLNQSNKHVPIKLFYLDQLTNQQATGRSMKLMYDQQNGKTTIYQTDFSLKNDVNSNEYNFMNKLFILYVNKLQPVLTFSFTINVNESHVKKSEKTEIMSLYMENNKVGFMRSCDYAMVNSQKINNMVSIWKDVNPAFPSSFKLVFSSPNGDTCSVNPADPNNLQIELPVVQTVNEKIRIITTVSPYEKIVLAIWDRYFIFRRSGTCTKANNFATLWSQAEKTMNNINLQYDTNTVKELTDVTLGYVNYLNYVK